MRHNSLVIMVSDEILSRETQFIYQNIFGFDPVMGNLSEWSGNIPDKSGKSIKVIVRIPASFPIDPPTVELPSIKFHPNITNGKFMTRSIARWQSSYHVFQIMREVRQVIANYSFTEGSMETYSQDNTALQSQLSMLKQQLQDRETELKNIGSMSISHSDTQATLADVKENTMIDIQNDAFALEDTYDRAEIDGLEFAKKFVALTKRYYMIEKSA